ncbi:MAG: hypothetical protein ACR2JY_14890 [Chloroflexota bacterium]
MMPGPHWLEGRSAVVHDSKTGDAITDIDLVQGATLWELKSATWAADPTAWANKHIIDKFEAYLRARSNIPYYEHAEIGVRFPTKPNDPVFRAAVETAVAQERAAHPDVTFHLDWGS